MNVRSMKNTRFSGLEMLKGPPNPRESALNSSRAQFQPL
jgi:hypothetical protein